MRHNGAYIDLTGRTFGMWTVVKLLPHRAKKRKRSVWLVKCECGTEQPMLGQNLIRGKNLGCGCVSHSPVRPYEALYNTIKHLAKKRGLLVDLTYEEYLRFTKVSNCHYCGTNIDWQPYNKMNGHKLDRKDNSLGYSKKNCVVCCARCNRAKSNHFTYAE
jgi:hypothetical protein